MASAEWDNDQHPLALSGQFARACARGAHGARLSEGPNGRQNEYGKRNVHPVLPAMGDGKLRLGEMDQQGIDPALLSLNVPGVDWFPVADGPSVARETTMTLRSWWSAIRTGLLHLPTLTMQAPDAAAAQLERTSAAGFRGAMIYSNVAGRPPDDPKVQSVFDTTARLEAPTSSIRPSR